MYGDKLPGSKVLPVTGLSAAAGGYAIGGVTLLAVGVALAGISGLVVRWSWRRGKSVSSQ